MKRWIRQLALGLSLVMLMALIGAAGEADTDELIIGEELSEGDVGLIDSALDLGDGLWLPGDGEDDIGIDLPELQAPQGYEPHGEAPSENDSSSAWQDLQQRIYDARDNAWIELSGNVFAGSGDTWLYVPAGKRLTLDLNGYTLSRGLTTATNEGFVIGVRGELEIYDSYGSGKITGGWNSDMGGGVFVGDGGKLKLSKGSISGNRTKRSGGGVWVSAGGSLQLWGGAISDNEAGEDGGGVCVTECAGYAGLDLGLDGAITGNRAGGLGGGVFLYDSGMDMSGGAIHDNSADSGGGVALMKSALLTMNSGGIERNTAANDGGGVLLAGGDNPSTLQQKGGLITGNSATLGGGVYNSKAVFHLYGGSVDNNVAQDGAGVFLNGGRMEMSRSSVSQNTATGTGGGVCLANGSTLIENEGYDIFGNAAKGGGGVFVDSGSRFELYGSSVRANTAAYGAGVAVSGYFGLYGGSVSMNTATAGEGGGIYSWPGAVVETTGGLLLSNSVPDGFAGGGGYFPGTLRVSGDPKLHGNNSGSKDSDCCLGYNEDGSHRIKVTGPLYSGANISVDYLWPGSDFHYPITSGLGKGGYLGAFQCSDTKYDVGWNYNGDEAEIRPHGSQPQPPAPEPTSEPTPAPRKVKLSKCKASAIKDQTYTGKSIKPAVTLKYAGKALKKGTDYTVVGYSNNKAVGLGKVTVRGKGNYTGTRSISFRILPRAAKLSKLTSGKKGVATVTWGKRAEAGGYQLQYGMKSSFAGAKLLKVKKAATTKTTIKGLKSGKTYYVRIRAYKTVGSKTYWSAWSKAKQVKVK